MEYRNVPMTSRAHTSPLPILLLGAGGFAEEVADLIEDSPGYEVVGFVESADRARCSQPVGDRPVYWVEDIGRYAHDHLALSALGATNRNVFIERVAAEGFRFATVRHPTAHVSRTAVLEPGAFIGAGVVVGAHSRIGPHALLNRGVLVGHHVEVSSCVSLMPGANLGGSSTVGAMSYVGMGALVLNNVRVGRSCMVGAGAVVTRDVPDGLKVRGIPAKAFDSVE